MQSDPHYYLADIERQQVEIFCNNKVMFEAVRKVFLAGIYENGVLKPGVPHNPMKNWAMSFHDRMTSGVTNENIGAEVRAFSWGLNEIERGFGRLLEIKPEKAEPETKKKPNKAL